MPDLHYDDRFTPPAPVITVEIGATSSQQHQPILALLDTGADWTVIPPAVIERMRLPWLYSLDVLVYQGDGRRAQVAVPVVQAHMRLGNELPSLNLECIQYDWATAPNDPTPEHVTIGRDVLNGLILALNGPERMGRIVAPATS